MKIIFLSVIIFSSFLTFVLLPMVVQAHEIDLEAERAAIIQDAPTLIEEGSTETEEVPTLDDNDETNGGPHFFYGEDVQFDEDVVGDVYVAGGNVIVDGIIYGDLMVAGGSVVINGEVMDDVRVAGGDVAIHGHVGEDITAVGGNVTFAKESQIDGSAVVVGGEVVFQGVIEKNTYIGAGEMTSSGEFHANVTGGVGTLDVQDGTFIAGDFRINTDDKFSFSESATVQGRRDIRIVEEEKSEPSNSMESTVAWSITGILMTMVGGGTILRFLPKFITTATAKAETSIFPTMGWGFIKLVTTPFVVLILAITVIGLPLAVILGLLYIVAIMMASWFTAYLIGSHLSKRVEYSLLKNQYMQLLIGAVVLTMLIPLPVVGGWVQFFSLIVGLGAMMQAEKALLFPKKISISKIGSK